METPSTRLQQALSGLKTKVEAKITEALTGSTEPEANTATTESAYADMHAKALAKSLDGWLKPKQAFMGLNDVFPFSVPSKGGRNAHPHKRGPGRYNRLKAHSRRRLALPTINEQRIYYTYLSKDATTRARLNVETKESLP